MSRDGRDPCWRGGRAQRLTPGAHGARASYPVSGSCIGKLGPMYRSIVGKEGTTGGGRRVGVESGDNPPGGLLLLRTLH